MTNGKSNDGELSARIDGIPHLVKAGHIKYAESLLRADFEHSLSNMISRYGELPILMMRVKPFDQLILEVRDLYVKAHFRGCIALCGMVVEAMCLAIGRERVKDPSVRTELIDPSFPIRDKITKLPAYLISVKTTSLLHQVLDIRKKYLRLHKEGVDEDEVLDCVNKLHLALVAEYGLVHVAEGKVRHPTDDDVKEFAKKLGLS